MAKNRPTSAPTAEHPLLQPLERIADELNLIRTVLDEIRSNYQWAVQNGRVVYVRDERRTSERLPNNPTFRRGDAVEIDHNRLRGFGEVLATDDDRQAATVLLIPSNESVTVPQESLRKVDPSLLKRHAVFAAGSAGPQSASKDDNGEMPNPGSLF